MTDENGESNMPEYPNEAVARADITARIAAFESDDEIRMRIELFVPSEADQDHDIAGDIADDIAHARQPDDEDARDKFRDRFRDSIMDRVQTIMHEMGAFRDRWEDHDEGYDPDDDRLIR